ncbi:hypothetical protein DRQ21_06335 [Candidatus Fermentibacteria bacterium]|nr:MAG: hypothetical protein DRQ21_06335 [Candidatus Fermentibacteria bacterium]
MAKKIRELIDDLKRGGFVNRGVQGSHRNFSHPGGTKITLSGNPSHDAKKHQERDVEKAIREVTDFLKLWNGQNRISAMWGYAQV